MVMVVALCSALIATGAPADTSVRALQPGQSLITGESGVVPAITTGFDHSCALLNTGQVSCWGIGSDGRLGTGTTDSLSAPSDPIELPGNTTATAISAGGGHSCALLNTGQVSCWGSSFNGQVGAGDRESQLSPSDPIELPGNTTATAIATGGDHSCAVLNTGQVSCWGAGFNGRLGTGVPGDQLSPSDPIELPGNTTATAIATGFAHSCAVLNTGEVSCWGAGLNGRLGTGGTADQLSPSGPISLPGTNTTATAIATGFAHSCAVLNTGQVSCWGAGLNGRLGTGGTADQLSPSGPISLPGNTTATAIATGRDHSCALLNTGQVSCWGNGGSGQLGTGNTGNLDAPSAPIELPATITTATAIATGGSHSCALLNTGQVSCWGNGADGRLGTGNTNSLLVPSAAIVLPVGTTATAIAAGNAHSCALLNTGQVSCWGAGGSGRLGTGNTDSLSVPSAPIVLPVGTTATAIAAGGIHSCALLSTGQVSCWGSNGDGRLGTGGGGNQLSPPSVPIVLPTGTTATAIAVGNAHSCALLNTGQVSCWGLGSSGRLGTGDIGTLFSPSAAIVLPVGRTATAIAVGEAHSCALLNTGEVSCWGDGTSGRLGTGGTASLSLPSAPIVLPGGVTTTATAIAAGGAHSCAVLNTGRVSCWGRGNTGQLGTVDFADLEEPSAPIVLPGGATTTATAIAAGGAHSCAVLNTGRVSCWGLGNDGRLGTGNTNTVLAAVLAGVPSVSVTAAAGQATPTAETPIAFTIAFDQNVEGFVDADVIVAGTAGATSATLSGGPREFTAEIATLPGDGTVEVSVSAGAVSSLLGSTNTVSNTATVIYDTTGPVATIDLGAGQLATTSVTPVVFSVSFDEDVTGFDTTDIEVAGTAGATTGVIAGSGADYTVTIDTIPNAGTVTLAVNAGAVTDALGNASTTVVVADTVNFQPVPGAPTAVSAVAGNGSATVSWAAPATTSGTTVIGYLIEQSTDDGATWTAATTSSDTTTSPATTATVTALTNGTSYRFRVAAINLFGPGLPSGASSPVTPLAPPAPPAPPAPVVPVLELLGGADRFATSVAVSQAMFPDGAEVVYLASGRVFADALVAGSYAALDDAPVLLVRPDQIPDAVWTELVRLAPERIIIVGGPGAISPAVEERVRFLGVIVTRVFGADRYATAVALSQTRHTIRTATSTTAERVVYVASGEDFADGLVAGPIATLGDAPVLLVRRDRVPVATAAELVRLAPDRIVIIGGPAAVTTAVRTELGEYAPVVDRVFGANRFATSVAVSRAAFEPGVSAVFLATGENFADALSAAAPAGILETPVLLTRTACVPAVVRTEIERLQPERIITVGLGIDTTTNC